jgi:ketosteroid isomerase-like protein
VVPPPIPRTEATSRPVSVEIAALVLEYARAIESRDMSRIKALYPSITAAQQRGFEQFFSSVRGLRASLATASPSVDGNTAAAQVTGAYEFTDAAGKPQRQPVAFRATFRSDNGRWLIASVR